MEALTLPTRMTLLAAADVERRTGDAGDAGAAALMPADVLRALIRVWPQGFRSKWWLYGHLLSLADARIYLMQAPLHKAHLLRYVLTPAGRAVAEEARALAEGGAAGGDDALYDDEASDSDSDGSGSGQDCATAARERGIAAEAPQRCHTHTSLPYRGVYRESNASTYRYDFRCGDMHRSRCGFADADSAARAYDEQMRQLGRRVVNFPRPGTREVQAVKGVSDAQTLARLGEQLSSSEEMGGEEAPPPPPRKRAARGVAAAAVQPAARKRPREASPPAPPAFCDAADFLRSGIAPPLHGLDAALAALPASGIELRHLVSAAAASPALQLIMLDIVTDALHLHAGDRLALIAALPALLETPARP